MNVHKQISKLKAIAKVAAGKSAPIFNPFIKLAHYTFSFLFPPHEKDGNPDSGKVVIEKSLFALALLSSVWILVMCLSVKKSPQINTATLFPELPIQEAPAAKQISLSDDIKAMVLEEFSSQKVADENSMELRKEVLRYMESLESTLDGAMSTREYIDKYNSLCMASLLLSKLSSSPGKQRLWSSIAIGHSEKALAALPRTSSTTHQFQELALNRFLSMALNYYQRGPITADQLKNVYNLIDKEYLTFSGYCQTNLIQALAEDGIMVLPNYVKLKNS